jgi:hypothetical protein
MPNHVRNVLKIKKLDKKTMIEILNKYTSPDGSKSIFPLNCVIDFDKIIPEPRTKGECPKDCIATEDSHIESEHGREWFDWYTWHNKYWGTKWGAYDTYTIIGASYITFVFSTAWNTPEPVINKLAEEVGHEMELRFADEAYGSNCACLIYNPSEHGWTQKELKNPAQFAVNLWNKY